ncbi:MAG: WD40 repeat domain-containing protein [Dysgonamonadaceae bacterium]|nr:WD40 repeat domain-containing protein [Dysgonamonadaceae bacterium]
MKINITLFRFISSFCFFILFHTYSFSQVELIRTYSSGNEIKLFDNTSFRLIYYVDSEVNTYKDKTVASIGDVKCLALNPSGSSFAVIQKKNVKIYSFMKEETKLFNVEYKSKNKALKRLPLSLTYTGNADQLLVSFTTGEIIVYDTKKYESQYILAGDTAATSITVSPNDYFIAAVTGKRINIWNFERKTIRAHIDVETEVTGIAFSPDASMLAITLPGRLLLYNTRNWENIQNYTFDDVASSPSFNGDDKYLAFILNGRRIAVLNIRKQEIIQEIPEESNILACRFFNSHDKTYLISSRSKAIVYWNANGLNPFYGKIINQEVDKKMNEWVKMMQGESMDEYKIRVNDSTRLKQMELFTQEATTSLAQDRISIENPFVGDYNNESNLLAINFTSLPPIEIPVPASELSDFGNGSNLKFNNAVYMINEEDEFVLAYIEVTNEVNNKVYIYDNIGRTRIEAIETDLNFVPLEILQIASQEASNLESVTENVMEENKQEKLITDNTQINVGTEVVADVDAEGNKILNYLVNYKYEVINKEFSEVEDFPPGSYDIKKSNAAMSLMKIIKNSFEEGDFAKYLKAGKHVKIAITGSADGAPIRGKIAYDERYGNFEAEPYYQNNELNNITVTKATGITENTQLAFIRAISVKDYLSNNIASLQNTQNSYHYNVEVAEERGGEYRRITIQFTIIDAFEK